MATALHIHCVVFDGVYYPKCRGSRECIYTAWYWMVFTTPSAGVTGAAEPYTSRMRARRVLFQ